MLDLVVHAEEVSVLVDGVSFVSDLYEIQVLNKLPKRLVICETTFSLEVQTVGESDQDLEDTDLVNAREAPASEVLVLLP